MNHTRVLLLVALLACPAPAVAYVGPGAGVSLVGAVVGLVGAIATALGFILLWPARALWKRIKARRGDGSGRPPAQPGAAV